jgi:N-acetylglutamate synthase-like GNAT family acetyltransferase
MRIREANPSDYERIAELLNQLGYPNAGVFLQSKINRLQTHPDEFLVVAEDENVILGVMSIHFIPQIALEGDFARISYFSIDEKYRSRGIGKMMEEYCTETARCRNCNRIEVHCNIGRKLAHRFYYRQGYAESPKYLIKIL